MTEQRLCTCVKCGWVHMGITTAAAQQAITEFNTWYDEQPPETQSNYGGRSTLADYERCSVCRGQEFRAFEEGDCPEGVTISPVIWRLR